MRCMELNFHISKRLIFFGGFQFFRFLHHCTIIGIVLSNFALFISFQNRFSFRLGFPFFLGIQSVFFLFFSTLLTLAHLLIRSFPIEFWLSKSREKVCFIELSYLAILFGSFGVKSIYFCDRSQNFQILPELNLMKNFFRIVFLH